MPVVFSKQPNGDSEPVYEVDLTQSGLLIQILEQSGRGILIDRFAWEGIKEAVSQEFAREERAAQEWIAANYREGDYE